jgi:iron complex outermembrane receptor protein
LRNKHIRNRSFGNARGLAYSWPLVENQENPMKGPSTLRAARSFPALCVIGALAPLPALAQSAAPASPAQLDTIIVTGTHARDRTEINSPSPVDVLAADDLRAVAGPEASLGQALQALLPSFNYLDQSNSGSADHVRAAQLRGLNPDQVLVLINGKRVHPTSIVNVESVVGLGAVAVDFNSIPVNAIKRVEVLRDGAGAQYGSDAIAGVINVILDDAPTGGELAINAGEFHTHFAPTNRSIRDGQTINAQGKYGVALGGTGSLRFGVDATSHQPTNRAGFDQLYPDPNASPNPNSTTTTFAVGDARERNLNLWLNSELPLAGGSTAYAVALYNHRTSTGDAFFREPLDPYANLPAVHPYGYLPESTGTNTDWHASAGAKGPLAGPWQYDASFTYGQNTFAYGLTNSLNASFGPSSPTTFNLGNFRFSQSTANLDLRRDLELGLAAPAVLAAGVELRRETYATTAGDYASYATGNYVDPVTFVTPNGGSEGDGGIKPSDVADTARNIAGVYADLAGNLVPSLYADASARYDHYSDAGSSTTGKLTARWEFVPSYALRGAISNNFRAPALAQISSAYSPTSYTTSSGLLGGIQIVPVGDAIARSLGAQPLRPERSHNYSLGLTAQPVSALQLSLDLFKIDINDRITLSQPLTPAAGNALYEFFTNAVDTETRGAEFVGSWSARLAGGTLRLSDASMWASNTVRAVRKQPAIDPGALGLTFGLQAQNAITTAVPKRRDVVSAVYSGDGSAGSWNLLARATHTGAVTRVFDFSAFGGGVPTQTYGATVQLDLEAEYKATHDLALALGAINLTDRYPTQSNSSINYYGNLPYDFLAPIGFNGRYVYLRVRYELR